VHTTDGTCPWSFVTQVMTSIYIAICRNRIFVVVELFEVVGGYSYCIQWWTCLPSLFKLSFHNL